MNRLFGSGKKGPAPSLNDAIGRLDERVAAIDEKIKKLDGDLLRYKEQLAKLPPNHPSREAIRKQAAQCLQQRKQYEQQRMSMMGTSFNLEQANFTVESLRGTRETVAAMQASAQEMKRATRSLNLDRVEDLRDTLQDMMAEAEEVNQVLSRSYETPDYVDEADLEAELEALEEYQGIEAQPSYLMTDLPAAPDAASATREPTKDTQQMRISSPEMQSK